MNWKEVGFNMAVFSSLAEKLRKLLKAKKKGKLTEKMLRKQCVRSGCSFGGRCKF